MKFFSDNENSRALLFEFFVFSFRENCIFCHRIMRKLIKKKTALKIYKLIFRPSQGLLAQNESPALYL